MALRGKKEAFEHRKHAKIHASAEWSSDQP